MSINKLLIKAKKGETLSSLYREIEFRFPDLDNHVDSFTIVEGKKAFFGAGDPVVKEIELTWKTTDPDPAIIDLIDKVKKLIEDSNQGSYTIEYKTDEGQK